MPDSVLRSSSHKEVSDRVTKLMAENLVWDSHAGFAFVKAEDLVELERWRQSGIDFVSVNIGYDVVPWTSAIEAASKYRHWIRAHADQYVQVETYDDVLQAKSSGKLAIAFDIEGMNALNGDPGMVDFYYRLGVRQMLFAYNRNNLVGGGCHDVDTGLTPLGREVLREMNRVGMIVDCSHCAYRTSMEAMEYSDGPVVFSHSNARDLFDHERNIRDDQIKACAAQGGVIGVTGVGLFLGTNGADPAHVLQHIDYLCQLVGPAHVGIGLDSVLHNQVEAEDSLGDIGDRGPLYWPARQYPDAPMDFVPPEAFPDLVQGMLDRGYSDADVLGILGGNFARLAQRIWKPV
jgi:membrane dipeptidase